MVKALIVNAFTIAGRFGFILQVCTGDFFICVANLSCLPLFVFLLSHYICMTVSIIFA